MVKRYLVILEVVWIAALVASTYARLVLGAYEKPSSLTFIRQHGPTYALIAIWACNSASALILTAFSVLHPVLAATGVIYMAVSSDSDIVASWLTGLCSVQHLAYSLAESQAFVLATWLGVAFRRKIARVEPLATRWSVAMKQVVRIACLVLAVFLALAALEVAEVLARG